MVKGWRLTWPRFAEDHRLTYILPRGTVQPVIRGTYRDRDVEVRLDKEKSAARDEANFLLFLLDVAAGLLSGGVAGPTTAHDPIRTCFMVNVENPTQASLFIKGMNRAAALKHTGVSGRFDGTFLIRSQPGHFADILLTTDVRVQLVESKGAVRLAGQQLTVEVPGAVAKPDQLQAQLDLACQLAEVVDRVSK